MFLQMINAVTDIQEDTLVELVINSQPLSDEDVEIRPHSLAIHSYKTPTFCHFCGEMLFGMFKQVCHTFFFHVCQVETDSSQLCLLLVMLHEIRHTFYVTSVMLHQIHHFLCHVC